MLTGSHVDTTLNAGRYDGVLGVLGAIDAVRALRADGFAPRRAIEVVAWAGEEPRFGTGCVGSRAAAGALARADLDALVDRDGVSMAAALRGAGFDPDRVADAAIDPAGVHALVELHIEQGIVLEDGGRAARRGDRDRRAARLPPDLPGRRDARGRDADAPAPRRARGRRRGDGRARADHAGVAQRHHGRDRRRRPRAARRDQRRPRRRRARRRRARHRFRVARIGRRGHRGGGARDRGPAPAGARPDPDRGGRPRGLRPPRGRGGRRRGRRRSTCRTAA